MTSSIQINTLPAGSSLGTNFALTVNTGAILPTTLSLVQLLSGSEVSMSSLATTMSIESLGTCGTILSLYAKNTGSLNNHQEANNRAFVAVGYPDGRFLLGGSFTSYSGSTANGIVRINANGTIDSSFATGTGFNGTINSIATQSNGNILVGGNFDTYNGTTSPDFILLNTSGSIISSSGFPATAGAGVTSIRVFNDNSFLLGGAFSGSSIYLRRYKADATVDSTFTKRDGTNDGATNGIRALAIQSNNRILAVGTQGVRRYTESGSHDPSFCIISASAFGILEQFDGKILVAGNFTNYSGSAVNRIVRLNDSGAVDNTFNMGAGLNVDYTYPSDRSIVQQPDGKLIIVGSFTTYAGVSANRIVRVNRDGSRDSSFVMGTGFNVNEACDVTLLPNNNILVAGGFNNYNACPRTGRMAIISPSGYPA